MTLLYRSRDFQNHVTGAHPEQPARLASIDRQLEQRGLIDRCVPGRPQPAGDEQIAAVHRPEYVARLDKIAADGGGMADADTVVSPQSALVARLAAGTVCGAVSEVMSGRHDNALCLVRPPGHHALPATAMGFCLLGNAAIAAEQALREGAHRVLIIDWDVHHGNGTQDIFYRDERVGFLSIHRWPFWPGSGTEGETGQGTGLGFTANLPIAMGTPPAEYIKALQTEAERFADHVQPDLILLSAGFDAHYRDPIGSLGLESQDFGTLTRIAMQLADRYCDGKIVSLLEGGYDLEALAESVVIHLEALLGEN